MHLRFRQIRYFVEIVDAGSMTRAAERLNLAPTALSLQMRKLEDEYGVSLLERHARGVTPTERGARFYESAREILELLAAAERELSERDGPTARYRLGISPSVLHAIDLAALLPGNGTRGGVSIHIVEGPSADLTSRLESGDIDFAFGWLGARVSVAHVDLVEEQFVFVTASRGDDPKHATGPTRAVTLAEVVASDLVRLGRQKASWEVLRQRAAQEGLRLETDRVMDSDGLARRILGQGLGTAILPVGFVDPERRRGAIAVHPIEGEPLARRLSFAWRAPRAPDDMDRDVIAYVDRIAADFQTLTTPYSRRLGSLADALARASA